MSLDVTFYRQWDSFPLSRERLEDDGIMICVRPNGKDEGGNYECAIEGVGSGGRTRSYIGARLGLFDDSWRALTDLPELFAALAALDTSQSGDFRTSRAPVALDTVAALLSDLGYRDRTPEFVAKHEHHFRCACGEVRR